MANNKALYPKRRELQKRNSKRQLKLDKVFECLSCNNTKSVICKLDFDKKVGTLVCELCPARYACAINHLSKEVDVYSDWVDNVESLKQRHQQQHQQRPQSRVTQAAAALPTPAVIHEPWAARPFATSSSASVVSSTAARSASPISPIVSRTAISQQKPRTLREQSRSPLQSREQTRSPLQPCEQSHSQLESCEQSRSPLESREKSRSPLQSREQTPAPTQTRTLTSTRTMTLAQTHKERVNVDINPGLNVSSNPGLSPYYQDRNDDNMSRVFQQEGFNQPWTQRNNNINNNGNHFHHYHYHYRQQAYGSDQGYGNNNQGYDNSYQSYGINNQQYGNSHNQGYGNINQCYGNNSHDYGNNSQGYGSTQNYMSTYGGGSPGYHFTRDSSPDRLGIRGRGGYSDH
ncbi:hypothetical protein BGW39_003516 [Mortierella sp. 14UC]|nr:hypothetical protein BGW39_003516 [Mortierella sp. 14UC]